MGETVESAGRTKIRTFYITFICSTTMFLVGNGRVIFELMNSEINEVVFVGEMGITFKCSVDGSESTGAKVQIVDPKGNILAEDYQRMYVNYIIERVKMDDGGLYTCNVTHMGVDGNAAAETANLSLNVQDGSSPRCFRNGSVGQPYKPGDRLLLSCYCRGMGKCRWISTVEGSSRGIALTPEEESVNGKKIVRVLIQYTSDTDNSTSYHCLLSTMISINCPIGPLANSKNDIIINPMENLPSSEKYLNLTSQLLTTSKGSALETTLESSSMRALDDSNSLVITILFIVGAVSVGLILLIILTVFVICISGFGRKKTYPREENESKTKSIKDSDNDDVGVTVGGLTFIYNTAYQGLSIEGNDVISYDQR